ncbi:hypothetical protein TNCV_4755451 [Trichonephila clavipes]|nr:hypothetical protein TNCV_4755451 [Trichonephila clavipes]
MVISRLWKQTISTIVRRRGKGRLKATPRVYRYLTVNTRRHRDVIVKELSQDFATTGKTISRQTVFSLSAEKAPLCLTASGRYHCGKDLVFYGAKNMCLGRIKNGDTCRFH